MEKKLLIRDLTLRDGQQSAFATRMNQAQVDRVLPYYKEANFYAMEVWGGAVPDSVMRFLNEDPWERLESIKKGIGDLSLLTALSRGRNLFGYNPYPEEVIEGFNRNAVKSGIGIMRIFDALNDVNNMRTTIKYVKENGGMADCAVCFTVDPKFSTKQRLKAFFKGKSLPKKIFTVDYFVKKAKELEGMGADMISIKDMAGLISPKVSGEIISKMKKEISIPIDFHTHCTPGYGLASVLNAIIKGVDIVDTNIYYFSGGPAAPSFELIQLFCDKLGIKTDVNMEAVSKINKELKEIRKELAEFDSNKQLPIEFDFTKDKLPAHIDKLFDEAIAYAKADDEEKLLETTHAIEEFFNFPKPNDEVKFAEIPGGMYTNMLSQLKQLKLDHLLPTVLKTVPIVRLASGCPPLVTPTSQIVGVQAVNYVIDENKGVPPYTTKSIQYVNLVKGLYGKTPIPVDPNIREKICGHKEEIPFDASNHQKQENPVLTELDGIKLAENEKEELLLELFPTVAKPYLQKKKEEVYNKRIEEEKEAERKKYEAAKKEFEKLSPQEKEKRLMDGLYNYKWTSFEN